VGLFFTNTQYAQWLWKMVRFDLGKDNNSRPIANLLCDRLPISIALSILSILIAYVIAIPVGIYSATHPYSVPDRISTVILFILFALPSFFVGTLLLKTTTSDELQVFGASMELFPPTGLVGPDTQSMQESYAQQFPRARFPHRELSLFPFLKVDRNTDERYSLSDSWHIFWTTVAYYWNRPSIIWDWLHHLVLPIVCLTFGSFAFLSRQMRAGMMEVVRQDYVRTARAKGLSEWTVIFKHALRNSLIPVITLMAGLLPSLIGGSVIIETIFTIDGMGRLSVDSIFANEYPIVMAIFAISAVLTLLGILMSDILYVLVNPQISLSSKAN
jgi:peptide/nickel transport system permease protein